MELGKRVRRRRERLHLTQEEVADVVGRSRPWLVSIEQGKGNPPAEVITALAVALDEDPREYLRLAGRVSLTAEDIVPARAAGLPPEMVDAIERAVTRALAPVVERLDMLLSQSQVAR